MRMQNRLLSALMIALMLVLAVAGASAEVTLDCHLGYDDTVTFLRPIPFQASVTSTDRDFSGTLQLEVQRYETLYDRYDLPITGAAGSTVNVSMPVTLTFQQRAYTVKWVENGVVVAQTELKPAAFVDPTSLIIGVLSDSDKSLSQLALTQANDPLKRMEYWRTIQLSTLSFPDTAQAMSAFDVLMVDGTDVSALSASQQSALDEWLNAGGLVIVGGGAQAATAFPYFNRYTGITAGALDAGEDISQTFLSEFKSTDKPLGSAVRLVDLQGASGKAIGGEKRLVDIASCGEGRVFTCGFSLSEAPFSAWQGRFALWQRVMLENESDRYMQILSERGIGNSSGSTFYLDNGISDSIPIPNGSGMTLPVILLAVFVLLIGFGGYFLLKRLDKRDLMWAVVPALSVVFALALWGVSGGLGLQQPVAASYTILRIDKDGSKTDFTGFSATSASRERIKLAAVEGEIDPMSDNNYYASSNATTTQEKVLRNVYELNALTGQTSVEMPSKRAWEQVNFAMKGVPFADCDVSGECVMDGDSLVFNVTNKGTLALEPGVILTSYGFVTTEALLPGQTLTATLKPDPANASKQLAVNNGDMTGIKDGLLLDDATLEHMSYYEIYQAYVRSLNELRQKDPTAITDEMISLRNRLIQSSANGSDWDISQSSFHYISFSDKLSDPHLIIDGKPVTRSANYGTVDTLLSFNPISKDGSVKFMKGSFPCYQAKVDAAGKPSTVGLLRGNYNYFQINTSNPVFGYDVSIMPKDMKLTRFGIRPSYAYYSYIASLYNVKTAKWDDAITYDYDAATGTKNEKITVTDLSNYIGDDGMLYAQFRKQTAKDDYAEIGTPILTMDGRLQ